MQIELQYKTLYKKNFIQKKLAIVVKFVPRKFLGNYYRYKFITLSIFYRWLYRCIEKARELYHFLSIVCKFPMIHLTLKKN